MSATTTPANRDARHDRETARTKLEAKVESCRKAIEDPNHFATVDPRDLLADAVFRLRWIDCAPEGARHVIAPLCDKKGVPCGMARDENVGPGVEMRAAILKRTGRSWIVVTRERHEARVAA